MPTGLTAPSGSQDDLTWLLEAGQVTGTTSDYLIDLGSLEGQVAPDHGAHFFDRAGLEGTTS